MRILADIVGIDLIVLFLILKSTGDQTIDAEAVTIIAEAIERLKS